ncbi:uncharacterized protein LY89DRAFT_731911 [Mollisia scopiformis]|uniref:AMP-activated protein kinase glycogen-binding domain-containing protein n=1 Tax=Mollisia scopiformis TaxID=149040 RepID=A0A194XH97_MOLSC|nr:uncharacterized protein LY89DRAFT_731911 [Mollisia scopiformis]KUJ19516.1 hypothetical protein LY89DRAFT_731911 [Mollisia scopiformis]
MASQTITVTVKYSKPGTQPPIYLAGSFSDPEWQPQEMQFTTDENNEHEFHKKVDIEEGKEYQYKFRLGPGDWWTLNEDSPTVTDDIGNKNNLLFIPKVEETTADSEETNSTPQEFQAEKAEPVHTPTMEKEKTPSIEETMGTRETDDALFADEIIKDTDEVKEDLQAPAVEGRMEPHSTPAIPEKPQAEHIEEIKHTKELQDIRGTDTSTSKLVEEDVVEPTPKPLLDIKKIYDLEDTDSKNVSESDTEEDKAVAPPVLVVEGAKAEAEQEEKSNIEAPTNGHDSAHLLAAEPADENVSRHGARTPDLANVAAEVADTAATLDREQPTPPISDDEAGRIGFRRMSTTPIPEVASTAAEVADVAAVIDKEDKEEEPREFIRPFDIDDGDLPETPPNEKVPKFSHECYSPPSHEEPCQQEEYDPYEGMRPRPEEQIDLNDPSIQMFPTDRAGILEHLRKMQERLPEDEVKHDSLDLAPPSPVVGPNGRPERLNFPAVSPVVLAQRSPSLDSIPEHNDEADDLLGATFVKLNGEDKPATNGVTVAKEEIDNVLTDDGPSSKKENGAPLLEPEEKKRDLVRSLDGSDETSIHAKSEQTETKDTEAQVPDTGDLAKPDTTATGKTEDQVPDAEDSAKVESTMSPEQQKTEIQVPEEEEPAKADSTTSPEQIEAKDTKTQVLDKEESANPDSTASPNEQETETTDIQVPDAEESARALPAEPLDTAEKKDVAESQIRGTTEPIVDAETSVPEGSDQEKPDETSNQHTKEESLDGVCDTGSHIVPAPVTPFIVGDRQLGHDEEDVRELRTGTFGPSITVQPATPFPGISRRLGHDDEQSKDSTTKDVSGNIEHTEESSAKDASLDTGVSPATPASNTVIDTTTKQNDTAKSSAIGNENDDSQIKSRKRQSSPARSLAPSVTANSMRSGSKDDDAKGAFLRYFFRLVFIDYIGGFFMRLCGARRRRH